MWDIVRKVNDRYGKFFVGFAIGGLLFGGAIDQVLLATAALLIVADLWTWYRGNF